jgi:hypothetical protein
MYYYLILHGFLDATLNNNKKTNFRNIEIQEARSAKLWAVHAVRIHSWDACNKRKNEEYKNIVSCFKLIAQKWCIVRACNVNRQTREG